MLANRRPLKVSAKSSKFREITKMSKNDLMETQAGESSKNKKDWFKSSYKHEATTSGFDEGFGSGVYSNIMGGLGSILGVVGSIPCLFCCPTPYVPVEQGRVGLFTRFGKYVKTVDPGLQYINLMTERLRIVDVRMHIQDIPRQNVITKDNVSVNIDSVLYWYIFDPYVATFQVNNVETAIVERTQTTLRQVIGAHDLQYAITNRDEISQEIESIIAPAAELWGVKIESILVKDFQFSMELQESLSAAAKERRLGASKVISAQAEVESAKLMRNAADILNSPAAIQIRYLDTLTKMAATTGAKVIFMPPSFSEVQNSVSEGGQADTNTGLTGDKNLDSAAILKTIGEF